MKPAVTYLIAFVMALLPTTRAFPFKRWLLRRAGARVGDNVRICSSARFGLTGSLEIGEGTWLGHEFLLVGGDAAVAIGRDCDIAPRVTFTTGSHELIEGGERAAGKGYSKPITVADGCWIGTGATLLGGTSIGTASVVAAGAVVRGEFPDRVLIGGVPARVLRKLDGKTP